MNAKEANKMLKLTFYNELRKEAVFNAMEHGDIACPINDCDSDWGINNSSIICNIDIGHYGNPYGGNYYEEHSCSATEGDRTCYAMYFINMIGMREIERIADDILKKFYVTMDGEIDEGVLW